MIPESLSTVKPFLVKASELKDIDPVVSYYCKLYAVEIILTEKLHLQSKESAAYAETLLDEIENLKNSLDDVMVNDKTAPYNHVEKFGVAVFNRGFLDIQNNTISQRTVSTLRASVDFLQLLKLWNDDTLSKDVTDKIRYAKYHSINIVKKLRSGENPNENHSSAPEEDPLDDTVSHEEPVIKDELEQFEKELEELSTAELESDKSEVAETDILAPQEGDVSDTSENVDLIGKDNTVEETITSFQKDVPTTKEPQVQDEKPEADPDIILQCQKLCKFAISALNYEDVANAKIQLELALNILKSA